MSEQKRNEQEKRFCMHCGSPIEGTERFCMKCGKELSPKPDQNVIQKSVVPTGKPAHKGSFLKYIGIAVGVVLVIGIIASMSGSSEKPKTDKTEVSAKTESSTETSRLSAYELYMQAQDNETMPYKISAKAVDFLKNHEELFPTKSEEDFTDSELVDNEVEAKHIYKNQEKYGDKFMILPELLVSQIWEIEIENGQYFSEINAVDALGQQYYIMYNGTLDNIFEEDVIYACALPLGVSTFKNTEGGDTWTVVMAGSSVGKIQDIAETDSTVAQENDELAPENLEQVSTDDYIFPEANQRVLSDTEINGLSEEELRLATNEIYARHGRKFSSEDLQEYFASKSWYSGIINSDQFDESILNEVEKENLRKMSARRDMLKETSKFTYGWIYGTYECHSDGLDAEIEIGWRSGDGTEYIVLTGSSSDGSAAGEFAGDVVSTKENNYVAMDDVGNVIEFYYNNIDTIEIRDCPTGLGGMNFPGFKGVYHKTKDLPQNVS